MHAFCIAHMVQLVRKAAWHMEIKECFRVFRLVFMAARDYVSRAIRAHLWAPPSFTCVRRVNRLQPVWVLSRPISLNIPRDCFPRSIFSRHPREDPRRHARLDTDLLRTSSCS